MNMHLEGHVYPPFRLRADRKRAGEMLAGMGMTTPPAEVPPTYFIFLRGERHGVDLFRDLDIPRDKALHAGQRYEWLAPIGWDDELEVVARIERISAKEGKAGKLWFADVVFEYRLAHTGALA